MQRQISLCEMYKVISQLLYSFKLQLSDLRSEWETRNYWFDKPRKVYMVIQYGTKASLTIS